MNAAVEKIAEAMQAVKPVTQTCEFCRFFLLERPPQGVCRRYPPTVSLITGIPAGEVLKKNPQPQLMAQTNFPGMMTSGWCGEWTMKVN